MVKYVDDMGRLVVISSGISRGEEYMSFRVKKSGSLQRIKSKWLPIRNTRIEAQEDLARYAEEMRWAIADIEEDYE